MMWKARFRRRLRHDETGSVLHLQRVLQQATDDGHGNLPGACRRRFHGVASADSVSAGPVRIPWSATGNCGHQPTRDFGHGHPQRAGHSKMQHSQLRYKVSKRHLKKKASLLVSTSLEILLMYIINKLMLFK